MTEEKFQRLAGLYTYCMTHHGGQWSRLYRIMCHIRFNPGRNDTEVFHAIQKNIGPRSVREEWYEANQWYRRYRDAGKARNHQ